MPDDDASLRATERWFLHRGIPHFIQDYSAGEDIFTRVIPLLGLVFLFEMFGAVNLDWGLGTNVAALVGAVVLVVCGWGIVSRLQGESFWRLPRSVGPVELGVFVVLPALVPVVFGGQLGSAALTALGNLLFLGVVYLVTSYGLIPMTRWALGQTVRQIGAITGLLARALPLLLLFSAALFINTEVWQVATSLDGTLLASTAGLFVAVGTVFLFSRLPGELSRLAEAGDDRWVGDCCVGTPLESRTGDIDAHFAPPPLSRRQKGNVLLVLLFSQAVQVLLVTVLMGLFFIVLGMLAIRPEVMESWLGDVGPQTPLFTLRFVSHDLILSRPLLNVAIFLATFAGFYFTVYAVIDPTYREQFFDEIVGEIRQAIGVRAAYLALRAPRISPSAP